MIAATTGPERRDAGVWARLAAPIPQSAISWRPDGRPVQRNGQSMVRSVAYVDAQFVRERLDSVVPGEWDLTLEALPPIEEDDERLYAFKARLSVLGVMREDIGQGRDYKSASSDAFKRAAVRFGVAHELYSLAPKWAPVGGAEAAVSAPRRPTPPHGVPAVTTEPTNPPDEIPACPKCGGPVWDNRLTKRNAKAPDFRCRDRSCEGVVWPSRLSGDAAAPTGDTPLPADDLPF